MARIFPSPSTRLGFGFDRTLSCPPGFSSPRLGEVEGNGGHQPQPIPGLARAKKKNRRTCWQREALKSSKNYEVQLEKLTKHFAWQHEDEVQLEKLTKHFAWQHEVRQCNYEVQLEKLTKHFAWQHEVQQSNYEVQLEKLTKHFAWQHEVQQCNYEVQLEKLTKHFAWQHEVQQCNYEVQLEMDERESGCHVTESPLLPVESLVFHVVWCIKSYVSSKM